MELVRLGRDLIVGATDAVWSLLVLVLGVSWEALVSLHTSYPRLEGLLVGVLLAWVLLRRDRHPWLRVVSAPLKLVLDILDLAWDQGLEVVRDLVAVPLGWIKKAWGWCTDKIRTAYEWKMGLLRGLKDRLSNKEKEK